jgi:hypothetical protein
MCGDSGGGSGSGGGDGGGDGGGGSDGVGGGATVVAALREGGGDSGRDHGEVGVHGEGAWKAEAGQTCHGGVHGRILRHLRLGWMKVPGAGMRGHLGAGASWDFGAHLEVAAAST